MPTRAAVNRSSLFIGIAGVLYVMLFARYFYLSMGRDHLGNAGIALLSLACSGVPALGCVLALAGPERTFRGWRDASLVLSVLLIAPLLLLWSYER
jgi:hypothetical protein